MSTPILRQLDARLIPREEFPRREWFYATPLWYYHRARTRPLLRTNDKFYKLVDHDLRLLCRLLHERGLRTTPSCQGHFYPRGHFRKVWTELTRERDAIRHAGLEVHDAETDERFLFRDAGYALPWPTFESFHLEAGAHQGEGYLGIWVPAGDGTLLRALSGAADGTAARLHVDARHEQDSCRLLYFTVDAATPEARGNAWRSLTDHVRGALRLPRRRAV